VPTGDAVKIFAGTIAFAGLAAALGASLGALVRNQVAAVVGLLLFLFVLDPAISALLPDVAPFTLSGLSNSITAGQDDSIDLLPQGVAMAIWALYAALFAAIAAIVTDRRDI
jgi:ABC-2 type transport system permease protein